MHLVRDVMSRNVLYVTPDATVRTAVELLRTNHADAIVVVEEGRVVGVLDALRLCLFDGEIAVAEAIPGPPLLVESDMPLAKAAQRMRALNARHVPVVEQGRLVGLLTERDLLSVWGEITDPLTGLPVQYQLRRWLASQMAAGREVVVLFLDLDNFGALNKARGHVFGDRVLRAVAEALRERIEPERDELCRYGGDEFAVGTIRPLAEARALAESLREAVAAARVDGEPAGVRVSIGLAGGRRMRPRPGTHVSATLDDLITRASTASTAAKHTPERVCVFEGAVPPGEEGGAPAPAPPSEVALLPRVVLLGYQVTQTGPALEVRVALRAGSEVQEQALPAEEGTVARALVTATAECLQRFAREPIELQVEETYEYSTPQGLACVGATISLRRGPQPPEHLVGTAPIRGDVYRSYVNAVLDATNRRLALALRPGAPPPA